MLFYLKKKMTAIKIKHDDSKLGHPTFKETLKKVN